MKEDAVPSAPADSEYPFRLSSISNPTSDGTFLSAGRLTSDRHRWGVMPLIEIVSNRYGPYGSQNHYNGMKSKNKIWRGKIDLLRA